MKLPCVSVMKRPDVRVRRIWAVSALLLLALWVMMGLPMTTAAAENRVFDQATLFTEQERAALNARAETIAQSYGVEVAIVTTADSEGKSSRDYADDFFDQHYPGQEGVLMLIDMDNRNVWVSTGGTKTIRLFTDRKVDKTLDDIYRHNTMKQGRYADAAQQFLSSIDRTYGSTTLAGRFRTFGSRLSFARIAGALILALLAGAGFYFVQFRKYLKPHGEAGLSDQTSTADYRVLNDELVDVKSWTVVVSSGSSGGGGGSSHISSGGFSHGGGGRSF